MEDGTRSDTAANIKKYAPKPKKTITSKSVAEESEEEKPKRKSIQAIKKNKVTKNKEKDLTDHELNIESDWY